MHDLTERLRARLDLGPAEIAEACDALLSAATPDDEKADFLRALADKGESAAEVAGFVENLLGHAVDPGIDPARLQGPMLDVCGTGGDRAGMFNVSTAVMFLAAAGGASVAKHGNRSITSKSGGADVLEALGVPIHLPPARARECLEAHGATFFFAPDYHPAFRAVAGVRKQLAVTGTRTIFNILGPLLNPARPSHQLAGVFSPSVLDLYPEALALLGRARAWVVHGEAEGFGLDEISVCGPTHVRILEDGGITARLLDAADHGIAKARMTDLAGGDAAANARTIQKLLDGTIRDARLDVVVANGAAALAAAGIASEYGAGLDAARAAIDSGRALAVLEALRAFPT